MMTATKRIIARGILIAFFGALIAFLIALVVILLFTDILFVLVTVGVLGLVVALAWAEKNA